MTNVPPPDAENIGAGLAETFEGFSAAPYPDPATGGAPWAQGFGSTRDIHEMPVTPETAPVTRAQAHQMMVRDMHSAFAAIANDVHVPMTAHEWAAVGDFIYNVGEGNFAKSTLLKLINLRDYEGAAKQFEAWDIADGRVLAGLLRRRLAEEKTFQIKDAA